MILVEIFSTPDCGKCAQAREALKAVVAGLEAVICREVNILDELDYAVDLGVLSPPAIAIDGELVFPTLPGAERLRQELMQRGARAL
ncbi:MAG: glutaredoxin [Rhodocyclaceae bacterium]|nr:glutaredoxin [Rhodocyclaceae bacterium]